LLFLLQQRVHGGRKFVQTLPELPQLIDRMVVMLVMLLVMVVVALTGRLSTLSTSRFARMPAAAGQRDGLLGVVPQGFAELLVERRVVVVEIAEEVSQAWAGHDRAS
jgi:hypothetical protein